MAIAFARTITPITETELNIIKHSRKSLLFSNAGTWVKKDDESFDVTMGSFDGAEVCELVGLYLLNKLVPLIGVNNTAGLYRDDGLAAIRSLSARRFDILRKEIIELFKSEDLSITIECNLAVTDYLEVTFDLPNNKYFPYRKPNNELLYINAHSNHPPSVIKELPKMVNKRISDLSSDKDEYLKAIAPYDEALKRSGYQTVSEYIEPGTRQKTRNRKVLWFNPPFSKSVKTNVGKLFLNLVRKHFTRQHHFFKVFNVNTLKLSYSCMPNMANIIKQSNARNLCEPIANQDRQCNCNAGAEECPLDGKCLTPCIVYKAEVTAGGEEHLYLGVTEPEWKTRYRNHATSFENRKYEKSCELSKFIWSLRDEGTSFSIKWGIAAQAHPYRRGTRRCDLCITKKTLIARSRPKGILNKRSEIVSKCRHRNKHTLNSI